MTLNLASFTSPAFWTLASWVVAAVMYFTGQTVHIQQVADAAAGLVTAFHVGGTHLVTASGKSPVTTASTTSASSPNASSGAAA